MSRAPFVMPKPETAFSRANAVYDTTIGWRFVNPRMKAAYGVDSMPETGENVAQEHGISRQDQDAFALRSQQRAAAAQADGWFAEEIAPVTVTDRKGRETVIAADEHLRPRSEEHTSELQSLMRISYAVFCLKQNNTTSPT